MKIIESNPSGPLSEEVLEAFETMLGSRLPSEYRAFLLAHNGPLIEPKSFWVTEDEWSSEIEDYFFGLHDGPTTKFKDWYFDDPSHFPKGCLPIAHDGMGNYICIGLSGTERGRIRFYNHESNWKESSLEDLEPIADSFGQFIESLFHQDDEGDDEDFAEPPITFGQLVDSWNSAGERPSEHLLFRHARLYIVFGKNKPHFEIESPHSRNFLDDLVTGATNAGSLRPAFRYGSATCSFVFLDHKEALLFVGIASEGHVICDNRYWKISPEVWETICDTVKAASLEGGIE